ncbi:tyrosine-type recombinase/integrase [Azospirillum rugosum]|uniref:Integrase n=1 Tax=Azospirillum rugosum TaxID=416170 RepID=A0ABS4SGH1_9PROT|nr:site-specific integrase [Azospirillum rugosum]MBP2291067.1 integrase [Azospirillum rugosum]MDQ0524869.1 integrase [Azospirillum rugosum]
MPKVKLTTKVVENAKTPAPGVQIDLFDATLPAFGLRVGERRKTWFIIYRFGGKQKRLTLGHFPELLLGPAREAAGKALELVEAGKDPADEKASAQAVAAAPVETFGTAAEDFLSKHAARHHKRPDQTRWFLDKYVLPKWRDQPVATIKKRDVLDLLDELVEQGKGQAANRVLDVLRKLFNWRLERSDDEGARNPCDRVKAPAPHVARSVHLEGEHIKALWKASGEAGYPWGPMVRIMLLTGQRRGEVASMRWDSVDTHIDKVWRLTPEQTKAGRAHIVPLSPAVVDVLNSIKRQVVKSPDGTEQPSPFVFTTLGDRPVNGFSKAKRRLDEKIAEDRAEDEAEPLPGWRLHDIRRTVTTGLSALGVAEVIKQRILNHAARGVTQRHYDQYEYLAEKRDALERWAARVDSIVNPPPANVVQLHPERVTG